MKLTIYGNNLNNIKIYLNVLEFTGSLDRLDITYTDFDYKENKVIIKRISEKDYVTFYVEEMDNDEANNN